MEIWTTIGSILISLSVTFLFNYFVGLPKKLKQTREQEKNELNSLTAKYEKHDMQIKNMQSIVDSLPVYRQQSLKIQESLMNADQEVIRICKEVAGEIVKKLDRLEDREKNALRTKILEEYRLYTDDSRNPMKAWSEMEEHSFMEIVKDYEALGGNDYVHKTIMPEMNRLHVVKMDNLDELKELYQSRRVK